LWRPLADSGSDFESIEPGKANIKHNQTRLQFCCFLNCFKAISSFADDLQV
jgi:hypothetical protein